MTKYAYIDDGLDILEDALLRGTLAANDPEPDVEESGDEESGDEESDESGEMGDELEDGLDDD